jgi:hypothetical protein
MDRRGSKSGERRAEPASSKLGDEMTAMIAARGGFAAWLREGRSARGLTIEDVARITRIQQRTLERLEDGRFDELPADVFVRGFIRNYARCVGICPDEALARYGGCAVSPAPVASVEAQALLDSMGNLAPETARATQVGAPRVLRARASGVQAVVSVPPPGEIEIESIPAPVPTIAAPVVSAVVAAPSVVVAAPVADAVVEPARSQPSRGRRRGGRKLAQGTTSPTPAVESKSRRRRNRKGAKGAETIATPVVESAATPVVETIAAPVIDAMSPPSDGVIVDAAPAEPTDSYAEIEIIVAPAPAPAPIAVPAIAVPAAVAARVARPRTSMTISSPSLVIDDDDPDTAEATREAREQAKEPSRRSFLPPILLDDDRSGRQGGLTLAVIILLIVATLTLSYLMRRPSSSGEGVTSRDVPAQRVG